MLTRELRVACARVGRALGALAIDRWQSARPFQGLRAALRFIPMARPSRPPGFDMTYRPTESTFGPPFAARIPSLLYLAVALAAVVTVVVAERSSSNSWLYVNIVERLSLIHI